MTARKTRAKATPKTNPEEDVMSALEHGDIAKEVIEAPAGQWLSDEYIVFTLYSITDRALVGIDGLKPVNKRTLQVMYEDGVTANKKTVKGARIAGNVMRLHPHGNTSIEDALAKMGQKHSYRVPLVLIQGQVGSYTGAEVAAARYWEAKLSKAGEELVKEISLKAIEPHKNYDGELDEFKTLPVRWPPAIINGSEGIAVGYKPNLIPHNPNEVLDAVIAMIKNPNLTVDRLLKIMPGPDFPTGGILEGTEGVRDYYSTGKGTVYARARYTIEDLPRGRARIIFYEFPYKVSHVSILKEIHVKMESGKLEGISKAIDNTGKKGGAQILIETKAGVNARSLVTAIFNSTKAKTSYSVSQIVLNERLRPETQSMLRMLSDFIELRKGISRRVVTAKKEKDEKRVSNIEAIVSILVDIDKAISIIRNSSLEDAREGLIKTFSITEEQADYILSMQLRRITKTDESAILEEKKELLENIDYYNKVLTDEAVLNEYLIKEVRETKKAIGDPRRTEISGMTLEEIKEEEKSVRLQDKKVSQRGEKVFYTLLENGKIKRSTESVFSYEKSPKTLSEGRIISGVQGNTVRELLLLTNEGMVRSIPAEYLRNKEEFTLTELGINLDQSVKILGIADNNSEVPVLVFTSKGNLKLSNLDSNGDYPIAPTPEQGEEIISALPVEGKLEDNYSVSVTSDGKVLVFSLGKLLAKGSSAGYIKGLNLKEEGASVVYSTILSAKDLKTAKLGIITANGSAKITELSEYPEKSRGGMGVQVTKIDAGDSILTAGVGEDVAIFNNKGREISTVTVTPKSQKPGKVANPEFVAVRK